MRAVYIYFTCSSRVLVILFLSSCVLHLLRFFDIDFIYVSSLAFSSCHWIKIQLERKRELASDQPHLIFLQMKSQLCLVLLLVRIDLIRSWESYELDLFDLVEELGVNTNFYDFLGVEKTAELGDIKKAYR